MTAANCSAWGKGTSSGGPAGSRSGAGIDKNPVDRPDIVPELLPEDFGRRIGGIVTAGAKASLHRRRWGGEPQTRKRDGGSLGHCGERSAFFGIQGFTR